MKIIHFVFLIAFFVPTPCSTYETNVLLHGVLECGDTRVWCYRVGLFELDNTRTTDDRIDTVGVKCQKMKRAYYKLNGTVNGDGLLNCEYEFGIRIRHNCSHNDNLVREIELPFSETHTVGKPKIDLSSKENVYDGGIPVKNNAYFDGNNF